jgi:catechol 2,3-dioxygenase-like lactoylglutathione lyase family enzyme
MNCFAVNFNLRNAKGTSARDIEATVAWYRNILGMTEAFKMNTPSGEKLGSVHVFAAPGSLSKFFPAIPPSVIPTSALRLITRPKPWKRSVAGALP